MDDCVYLLDKLDEKTKDGRDIRGCRLMKRCVKSGNPYEVPSCEHCQKRLHLTDEKLATDYVDPLIITDVDKNRIECFRGMLKGLPTFLVCGGPSAKKLPLDRLDQRGIYSLGINNSAGFCRTNAFVCSDPPSKFHNGIWQDPNIDKFIPIPKLNRKRGRLRRKIDDDTFDYLLDSEGNRVSARDCPRVWGFNRRSWFLPDDSFFLEDSAAWGNHKDGVEKTGEKKSVCTMLLGMRLLYYLGSRRIYLVGVDFWMNPLNKADDQYAFPEEKQPEGVETNNELFRVVNEWLCKMAHNGVFDKFGLEIYNCNPNSGLRAFPHVPFGLAIQDALKDFPKTPFDLKHWYRK